MSASLTEYVLGFMFDPALDHVVLIEKQRPKWQAGRLNGVGGKLEGYETFESAMVREFQEETGLATTKEDWSRFIELLGPNWHVIGYCGQHPKIHHVKTMTDEKVLIGHVPQIQGLRTIANLQWLVPMARDFLDAQVDSPHLVTTHYK